MRAKRLLIAACVSLALTAQASAQDVTDAIRKDMAPTGTLRAAINLGNGVLAQKDDAGAPKGITPDLARELGKRLGVPVTLVPYEAAGKVFDAAKTGEWDIAFVANEPARAQEINFSAPYVIIEGNYMVRKESPLQTPADVDKPGIRIAVGLKSAYDLFLTRTIRNATIVRASAGGGSAMIELFIRDNLDVVAGVKQPLVDYARAHPEMRVLPEHFMEITQAMGVPKGRPEAARYLQAFVEDVKGNGFVAEAIRRSRQSAAVAPAAQGK